MREHDISQWLIPGSRWNQVQIVQTSASYKPRSDVEKLLLMRSTRNRFLKSVESGKIQIVSKKEWILS